MSRIIYCNKLNKQAPGLAFLPYPGELGKRIYDSISQEAWSLWLKHQTMLINEYRLTLADAEAREFLAKEMEKFLFGEGSSKPSGYIPPEENA
ncbi:MAG: Fe(II) trafficking protein YggX [Gammaproteobacteria bacterium]|jgi:Fe-S cluster biosynthesis and repair protein YggX|nr:Fe(II) trafficking protein YggX [Gammaproteobacteria bacterium]